MALNTWMMPHTQSARCEELTFHVSLLNASNAQLFDGLPFIDKAGTLSFQLQPQVRARS